MDKFKIGDRITPKETYRGFDNAVITGKDDKFYYLKIMNGKATIPLSAIECYKKVQERIIKRLLHIKLGWNSKFRLNTLYKQPIPLIKTCF